MIKSKIKNLPLFSLISLAFIVSCSSTNNMQTNDKTAYDMNIKDTKNNNQKDIIESVNKTEVKNCDVSLGCTENANTDNKPKNKTNYKLPENTPFFIADFIKNNPELDNPEQIVNLLTQQTPNDQVIKLISPATQPLRKNWLVYRSKFVEPVRIKSGISFWNQNIDLLKKVEQEFKVDASIIVGIIGVESIFGRQMGNFNVLNTLYTLSFYYPETYNKKDREKMFQKQLVSYINWSQTSKNNQYNHIGSFAGAMGMPQFMPESIQKYAVDYDKDGIINLTSSVPDVVASVANFLKQHGWKYGEKVILNVDQTSENVALLKANATGKPKPSLKFEDLPSLNLNYANHGLKPDTKMLVVDLPSGNDIEYKIGLENFYVLTRYNQSFFYALSVYELGKAISDAESANQIVAFKSK